MALDNLVVLGFIAVIIGVVLIVVGALQGGNAKVAVGGFIGPIPFGWANDPRMLQLVIALSLVALVVFIIFSLK